MVQVDGPLKVKLQTASLEIQKRKRTTVHCHLIRVMSITHISLSIRTLSLSKLPSNPLLSYVPFTLRYSIVSVIVIIPTRRRRHQTVNIALNVSRAGILVRTTPKSPSASCLHRDPSGPPELLTRLRNSQHRNTVAHPPARSV